MSERAAIDLEQRGKGTAGEMRLTDSPVEENMCVWSERHQQQSKQKNKTNVLIKTPHGFHLPKIISKTPSIQSTQLPTNYCGQSQGGECTLDVMQIFKNNSPNYMGV